MALSTDAQRANTVATTYDKKLRADDPRFRHAVLIVHEDGSVFHLRNAFLVKWQDPTVKPFDWLIATPERKAEIIDDPNYAEHKEDGLWLFCFTEHHQFFFWPMSDLASYAQFETRLPVENLVP